jgi:hypothetical protein
MRAAREVTLLGHRYSADFPRSAGSSTVNAHRRSAAHNPSQRRTPRRHRGGHFHALPALEVYRRSSRLTRISPDEDRDALGDQAILRAEAVRASSHSDSPNSKRGPPLPMRVLALAVTAGIAYVSLRFGTAARALCIRRTAAPAPPAGWPPPRRCRCSSNGAPHRRRSCAGGQRRARGERRSGLAESAALRRAGPSADGQCSPPPEGLNPVGSKQITPAEGG